MSWEFLHVRRRTFQSSDNFGTMFMVNAAGEWEKLCYTFERPWFEDEHGRSQATYVQTSTKKKVPGSRIREGTYELVERSDGPKGWRLELKNTEHRTNIQIHRAHKSLYIEGCILPVSFLDFREFADDGTLLRRLKRGDQTITSASVKLMGLIRARYQELKATRAADDCATLVISAFLPAYHRSSPLQSAIV